MFPINKLNVNFKLNNHDIKYYIKEITKIVTHKISINIDISDFSSISIVASYINDKESM